MINFLWILFVYIAGIFLIGLPIAKKSLSIWIEAEDVMGNTGGFWGHILFPTTATESGFGDSDYSGLPFFIEKYFKIDGRLSYSDQDKRREYVGVVALLWPLKILWNIFFGVTLNVLPVVGRWIMSLGKIIGEFSKT
jgi:hypothetical protein